MNFLGLINKNPTNYLSVILVLAVSATSIFLLRQYFLTIPRDLEEAARIDGAGYFQTFWQVILPLAAPALAAVGVLTFQGTWNGLFWPLVMIVPGEGALDAPGRHHPAPRGLPHELATVDGAGRNHDDPDRRPLRLLPALFRGGHRGGRCQGLKDGRSHRHPGWVGY